MNPSPSSRAANTSFGLLAIFLWSTSVAFGRSLGVQLGPMTSGAGVYLSGGIVGCAYLLATGSLARQFRPRNLKYLLGCGTLFFICVSSFYLALAKAADDGQVLEIGMLNYLWPTLTLVFSLVLLPMRPRALFAPGVALSMTGIVLAMNHDGKLTWAELLTNLHHHWLPFLGGLTSGLSWAFYSTLSRRWGANADNGAVPIFMLLSGVIMVLASHFGFHEQPHFSPHAFGELAFISIASNSAYVLWDLAVRRGDIVLVASASYFIPLMSTFFSCMYLHVTAGVRLWVGCALVVAGASLCKASIRERTTAGADAAVSPDQRGPVPVPTAE